MTKTAEQARAEVTATFTKAIADTKAFYELHPDSWVLVLSGSYQALRTDGEKIAILGKRIYHTATRWHAEKNAELLTEKFAAIGSEAVIAMQTAEYQVKHVTWLESQIAMIAAMGAK